MEVPQKFVMVVGCVCKTNLVKNFGPTLDLFYASVKPFNKFICNIFLKTMRTRGFVPCLRTHLLYGGLITIMMIDRNKGHPNFGPL